MLNVSRLITDPTFCQQFTITRSAGNWVNGDFVTTSSTVAMVGVIVPLTTKELAQLPDGDSIKGAFNLYTKDLVYTTHLNEATGNSGNVSDELTFKGEPYKIMQVRDLSDYGYYKALAVRKWGA